MRNPRHSQLRKKARALVVQVHRATRLIPPRENSVLIGQLRRSALSVLADIEGGVACASGRHAGVDVHPGTEALMELEHQLYAAADAGLLPIAEWQARGLDIIAIRGLLVRVAHGRRHMEASARDSSDRRGALRHRPVFLPARSFSHQYSGKLKPSPPTSESATKVGQATGPMGRFAK